MAYRGYLIKTTLTGEVFVECGGARICWAKSVDAAKAEIDGLLD